ncbi:uncharacterized protein LOC126906357 [Daktulosphaira vitifoliae]|uniref:uncharacterized protein LOC126906357 n=1 Tax=Daktulosphaira vitifoliae TaxID=58002 RepID=UPI0021A9B485|nr:uncharacterized protein LOC126906357 [Daktulosphaira vitifoliae]
MTLIILYLWMKNIYSAPRLSYRTPVVGRTLRQITDQAIQEFNDPMEAIVWLRNDIESIGITLLLQYSQFTANTMNRISKEHEKFSHHFNEASTFFNFLSEKFKDYRLRIKAIDEIISIFNEYNQSPKLEEDKQKFFKHCWSFLERFISRTYLVKKPLDAIIFKVLDSIGSYNMSTLEVSNVDLVQFHNNKLDRFYSYIEFNAKMLKGKK